MHAKVEAAVTTFFHILFSCQQRQGAWVYSRKWIGLHPSWLGSMGSKLPQLANCTSPEWKRSWLWTARGIEALKVYTVKNRHQINNVRHSMTFWTPRVDSYDPTVSVPSSSAGVLSPLPVLLLTYSSSHVINTVTQRRQHVQRIIFLSATFSGCNIGCWQVK